MLPPSPFVESIPDIEMALNLRLKALELDELLGNAVGVIGNCIQLAELYTLKGDLDLAEPKFQRALRTSSILSADIQTGRIAFLLGAVCYARDEIEQGAVLFRKAVDIFGGFQCEDLLSKSCHALACVYRRQGRIDDAEALLQRSLDIEHRRNEPLAIAAALSAIGAFHLHLGRAMPSQRLLHQALALYKAAADDSGRADSLGHLGLAYILGQQLKKAESFLIQARQLNITIQRTSRQADNAANLANICRFQGRVGEACRYYLEALAIYEADGRSRKAAKARDLLNSLKGLPRRKNVTRESLRNAYTAKKAS